MAGLLRIELIQIYTQTIQLEVNCIVDVMVQQYSLMNCCGSHRIIMIQKVQKGFEEDSRRMC